MCQRKVSSIFLLSVFALSAFGPEVYAGPPGFQDGAITWPADQQTMDLCVMISANDKQGFAIHGVRKGDTVVIENPRGSASFSLKLWAKALKFLVSAAAEIVPDQYGPIAEKGEKYLEKLFKKKGRRKHRNAYGQMRKNKKYHPKAKYARKNGGIVVSMPIAGGPVRKGGAFKIKNKTARTRGNLTPELRRVAMFPVRGSVSKRTAKTNGTIRILAWDSKHKDNVGAYFVCVRLKRGS